MRVLLIKTSSLGDVIHTLPALTDAQRAIPGIRFDWVVEEGFAEIPGWHPAVDEVIPVAIRRWRKNFLKTWRSGEWRAFKGKLASRQYDLIIDAQGLLKSAMLTRLNDAPAAGYDRQSIREPIASRFYNRCYSVSRQLHAVERIRQLFASALDYPLPREVGDYGIDLSRLPTVVAPQQPFVVFCHGTTWKTKHWPESYWRQLAERVPARAKSSATLGERGRKSASRAYCRRVESGGGIAEALPVAGGRLVESGPTGCCRGYRAGSSDGCRRHPGRGVVRPDRPHPDQLLWA